MFFSLICLFFFPVFFRLFDAHYLVNRLFLFAFESLFGIKKTLFTSVFHQSIQTERMQTACHKLNRKMFISHNIIGVSRGIEKPIESSVFFCFVYLSLAKSHGLGVLSKPHGLRLHFAYRSHSVLN